MSAKALDRTTRLRRLCGECRKRRSRFQIHGVVKSDSEHDLCFQCFRRMCNQATAARLKQFAVAVKSNHREKAGDSA